MKKLYAAIFVLALLAGPSLTHSQNQHQRGRIKQLLETDKLDGALWRALVKIMLNEFNLHAAKHNAILDAVDAATSLADLKTRIGAIPDYPTRTQQQLINALKQELAIE